MAQRVNRDDVIYVYLCIFLPLRRCTPTTSDQIAEKEAEMNGVVAAARQRSDRRVRGRGRRLDAENELEEALLELNVRCTL